MANERETEMKDAQKSGKKFRLIDFLVILLCLSGAGYSINLFRLDLFQTINGQNVIPVGTVTFKKNTVQRRMTNRVIWDRLIKESPVYIDDMIRVAELSEASLHIGGNDIFLNENTLIRIRRGEDGSGEFQIDLASGNMNLAAAPEGEKIILNIMGRQVEAQPGTTLSAAAGNDGMALHVSEGAAKVKEAGESRELAAGAMIALDAAGSVRPDPAAVIIQPRPNAYYRGGESGPVNINFSWNRINLQPQETLRLEIAEDPYFSRIVRAFDGLDSAAQAALNAGVWHWRLSYRGAVLGTGRVTVEASGPALLSPAMNQQFYYETELPMVYFQWSGMDDVSSYLVEVDVTPEFRNPVIKRQTAVTSFADSSLGPGIWHWRVLPIFSHAYEGGLSPRSASFRIIEDKEPQNAPLIAMAPPPASEPPAEPPVAQQQPPPPPAPVARPQPQPQQPPPRPPARPPQPVTLESPANGTELTGLNALRQQTVFRWGSEAGVEKARFVLSRDSNPLTGKPEIEILDPNRTIRLDRLKEGVWYWTVEAHTPEGVDISARQPRQLRVLPIPLLPAPENRQPAANHRVGIEELKKVRIDFRWWTVLGANGYIFTLYQEDENGQRQITQTGPENRTDWSMDIKTLGRGNFIWQVEAVSVGQNGVIEQRGSPGRNSFVIDIPRPGPVQIIEQPEDIDDD
ncbi:MAG: hypothetical protein LBB89_11430 [Treponema sp.]|jgi:hypothetical protein|nr:hypothetical protein [Treponema sp.]